MSIFYASYIDLLYRILARMRLHRIAFQNNAQACFFLLRSLDCSLPLCPCVPVARSRRLPDDEAPSRRRRGRTGAVGIVSTHRVTVGAARRREATRERESGGSIDRQQSETQQSQDALLAAVTGARSVQLGWSCTEAGLDVNPVWSAFATVASAERNLTSTISLLWRAWPGSTFATGLELASMVNDGRIRHCGIGRSCNHSLSMRHKRIALCACHPSVASGWAHRDELPFSCPLSRSIRSPTNMQGRNRRAAHGARARSLHQSIHP
jgi:hypothetical protein